MSSRAAYFLAGFSVGAVLSLAWNAIPIIRTGGAPSIPGIWVDIAVQAVIVGLVIGVLALFFASWRRNRT